MDIERYIEELSQETGIDAEQQRQEPVSLTHRAVELWRSGERFFLVTDGADARAVVERGIGNRGEVWTYAEVEVVARIADQSVRDEVEHWKRITNGTCRSCTSTKAGTS